MAAASMLAAFAPPVLLRSSASFAPPRRASASFAVAVRAAAKAQAAEAAPKKKRAATGITMPRPVSPALQAVVGAAEVPRTEAIKRLWAYIKQNNLQV
jgi:chromatin remodeling complex protein RSC6